MFKQKRLTILSIAVLLALLVAAVLPFAALAQDGGGEGASTGDVTTGESASSGEVSTGEGEPTGEISTSEGESIGEVSIGEVTTEEGASTGDIPVAEDPTVPEIMAELPADTELVVLDANSQPLALASEAALANVFTGDPMWCPQGVAPQAGVDGCTGSFTKFNGADGLIAELMSTDPVDGFYIYQGAGTIYIAYDYNATTAGDYGNDIVFDYAINGLTDLVFQGGWDFTSNKVVETSTFDLGAGNWLVFLDWDGYSDTGVSLTLKDINVVNSGGLYAGPDSDDSNANVTLDNVSVSNNTEGGAAIYTTGDVTVLNSHFDSNTNSGDPEHAIGLQIGADGNVTLNTLSASYNTGNGVVITSYGSSSKPASMLVENSVFNGNDSTDDGYGVGLSLDPTGNATVKCSQFIDNNFGIYAFGPSILTNDTNTFSGNGMDIMLDGDGGDFPAPDQVNIFGSNCGCVPPVELVAPGGDNGNGKKKDTGTYLPQVIAVPTPLTDAELPGALPEGKTFAAGASIKLMLAGEEIEEWPAGVQVTLDIPAGMEPPFTVLSWNGTAWVEVPSAVVDGKIVFTITKPGFYVLVSP